VLQILKNATGSNGYHLLIFGGRRSGKSTLSMGIGTELAIKRRTCSYYPAMKLLNTFSLSESEIMASDDCDVWTWRSASLLIVDDINPGSPIPNVFLSSEDVLGALRTGNADENAENIKNKNV